MQPLVLSIVIVNWHSADYVMACIRSIREQNFSFSHEVIVVDNASFDGCGERLTEEYPEVVFVQSRQNIGFARGNNLGFKYAAGEYLLLLNPDTELRPGAVTALLTALQQQPTAGIVAPRLLNTDGSLQTSCVRALPTPLNRAMDCDFFRSLCPRSRLWQTWKAYSAAGPTEIQAASGACLMMRADTFRRVNGFSREFFMYGEDMDLCARVSRLGFKLYHVPDAEVVHHGGGSSRREVSQFSTVMMRVAGETYMRLNHGPGAALRYRLLQAASALVRLGLLLPAAVLMRGHRQASADATLRKWWGVLHWVVGTHPIPTGSENTDAGRVCCRP